MISSAHWSSPDICLPVMLALQVVGVFVPINTFMQCLQTLIYHKFLTLILWNF